MSDSDLDRLAGFLAPILQARDTRVATTVREAESAKWREAIAIVEAEVDRLKGSLASQNARVASLSLELERAKRIIRQLTEPGVPPVVVDPPVIVDPPVVVDPPIIDPPSSGDGSSVITAHDYLGRTAEENLTIPRFNYLRANRAPRSERVGTKIYHANEVTLIENIDQRAVWASCIGLASDYPQHRQKPLTLRNVGHSMHPNAGQPTKWGDRFWSCSDTAFIDCDYHNIPEEHAKYVNLSGNYTSLRCTHTDLGGHSEYICLRNRPSGKYGVDFDEGDPNTWQYPPNNAVPTAPQTHIIEDCHSRNTNQAAAKGSNTLEFFNLGTLQHQASVYVRDCTDVQAFPFQLHTGTGQKLPVGAQSDPSYVRSYAACIAKTYQDQKPAGVRGPHTHPIKTLSFENCLWDYTQANKELMNLNDAEQVVFDSCTFIARNCRQPVVRIDGQLSQGHASTNEVILANCAEDGCSLEWLLPNGTTYKHTLDTRGRFIRLRRLQSTVTVENVLYDPAYRVTRMESASA